MEARTPRQLIEAYIEAYNRFDAAGMVGPLHDEVVFKNISNGEVNLTTVSKAQFQAQAEQARHYFSEREQRVTEWQTAGDEVTVLIDYRAVAAMEFPNGLQPGDELKMTGKSVFRFRDGQIISIEDIS
ncbi:MAG: nuclear transport factor 2 family protein [Janthinobacterium lividum]